ncbi:MAG: hypothetical protein K0S33_3848 [Bacteroidetes bacterium]|jgi:hypothetical protein|nr:hypothetical protein [Bacteroidota bacterium]
MMSVLKTIIISTLCFSTLSSQTKPDTINRLNSKHKKEGFWKVYLTDYLIETEDTTQAYYFAYDYFVNGHLIIWTSSAQYYKKKAIRVTTDNQSNKGQPVLLNGHFQFYYSNGLGLEATYKGGLPVLDLTIGSNTLGKSVTIESLDYSKKYKNQFGSFLYERFNLNGDCTYRRWRYYNAKGRLKTTK